MLVLPCSSTYANVLRRFAPTMHVSVPSNVGRTALPRQKAIHTLLTRLASTSSKHPFPFPLCANPTPHEIFHLPRSASQAEIKARYYELVKVYHPDARHRQHDLSLTVRNARFRAITHAYNVLHGQKALGPNGSASPWDHRDEAMRAELRRRSRRSRSASSSTAAAGAVQHENPDDAQVRFTLVAFLVLGIIAAVGSVSSHLDRVRRHTESAAANLAQARADAQVYGMERRRKIRERVRSLHESRETVLDGNGHLELDDDLKVWQLELLRGAAGPELENVSKIERT